MRLFIFTLLLAACSGAEIGPSQWVSQSDARAHYRFDSPETPWDVFTLEGDQALFRLANGALEGAVIANRGYIWSLNHARHNNIAVKATVRQTRGSPGSAFGLMCRADSEGNGYYFLISSNGHFSIRRATPQASDPAPLVDWQPHPALQQGLDETNELEMICAGDYLVLSANGQFLAEARDSTYSAGELGTVVGAVEQAAWVSFDDIIVRDAAIAGAR